MAEKFDAASGSQTVGSTGAGNTDSWTHTPVNTPNAIVADVSYSSDAAGGGDSSIAGITYGGVAMTFKGLVSQPDVLLEKWTLLSPASGAKTVSLTWAGVDASLGCANTNSFYSDAAGTATFGSLDTQLDGTSPITNDVAGTSANNVLDHGYIVVGGAAFVTVTVNGTNETRRSGVTNQFSASHYSRRQTQTTTQTSANGTVTASSTLSANRNSAISSIEVQEVIAQSSVPLRMRAGWGL